MLEWNIPHTWHLAPLPHCPIHIQHPASTLSPTTNVHLLFQHYVFHLRGFDGLRPCSGTSTWSRNTRSSITTCHANLPICCPACVCNSVSLILRATTDLVISGHPRYVLLSFCQDCQGLGQCTRLHDVQPDESSGTALRIIFLWSVQPNFSETWCPMLCDPPSLGGCEGSGVHWG